ncbi:MAG: hypothetical protein ACT4PV_01200 [Planctomycetaceae bacterium]
MDEALSRETGVALDALEEWFERAGTSGHDPYDALASPLLRAVGLGLKWPRIAVTQTLRRLPFNPRPWLLVPRTVNPKGLALILRGHLARWRTLGRAASRERARALGALLERLRSPGCEHACWGYPFPWQSRAFHLPAHTPNIVVTSFVGQALLDLHECEGGGSGLALAQSACRFLMEELRRREEEGGFCFSYSPRDETAVYNASLLGAALLARAGALDGDERALDAARRAARFVIRRQRDDGSWTYAGTPFQEWVDAIHTGFLLDSLRAIARLAALPEAEEAAARGHRFFLDRFLSPDGAVATFLHRPRPYDVHAGAQAILTLCVAGPEEALLRSARWFLRTFRDPSGFFVYRVGRVLRARIAYHRWGQAWAFRALAALEERLSRPP